MSIFDHDRLNQQSLRLAKDSAADRPPRPIAQKRAATALRIATTLLGLDGLGLYGRLPVGGTRRKAARRKDPLSPRLREAADLRADLAEAMAGALDYAAGREGDGVSGLDNEDDSATTVALLLAIGNACIDAAARLQALAGTPRDDSER